MYNGIGLTTPRGSGTNGHVQRNWAFVRPGKKDNSNYRSEEDIKKLDASINRPPNKDILDHDRKRKIEVKCLEFEEILEKQGLSSDDIKAKVDSYRQKLMGQGKTELPKDEFGRIAVRDTHQIAEAQQEKNAKLREAFNISEYFIEGSSFDSDRKVKEELAKSLALQKELDAQREKAAATTAKEKESLKRYALVRTPSLELDVSSGAIGDNDHTLKKKRKKRTRDSSVSADRKKEKKKKSKKRKKESKSKKSKKEKRKYSESDSNADNDKYSNDSDTSSEAEIKKIRKKSKKDKKKRDKKNKKKDYSSSSEKSRSTTPVDKKATENKKESSKSDIISEKKSSDYPLRSPSKEKSSKEPRRNYDSSHERNSRRSSSKSDRYVKKGRSRSRSSKVNSYERNRSEKDSRNDYHRSEIFHSFVERISSSTDYRRRERNDDNHGKYRGDEIRRSRSRQRSKPYNADIRFKEDKRKHLEESSDMKRIEKRMKYSRSPSKSPSIQSFDPRCTVKKQKSSLKSKSPIRNFTENRKDKTRTNSVSGTENIRKSSTPPPQKSKTYSLNNDEIISTNFNKQDLRDTKGRISRTRISTSPSTSSSSTDTELSRSKTPSPKKELLEKSLVSKNIETQKLSSQETKSVCFKGSPSSTERSASRSRRKESNENAEENKDLCSETPPPPYKVDKKALSNRSSRDSSDLSYSPARRNPERYRDILETSKNQRYIKPKDEDKKDHTKLTKQSEERDKDRKEKGARNSAKPVVRLQSQSEDESDGMERNAEKILDEFQESKHERELKDLKMLEELKTGIAAKAKEKIKTIEKMAASTSKSSSCNNAGEVSDKYYKRSVRNSLNDFLTANNVAPAVVATSNLTVHNCQQNSPPGAIYPQTLEEIKKEQENIVELKETSNLTDNNNSYNKDNETQADCKKSPVTANGHALPFSPTSSSFCNNFNIYKDRDRKREREHRERERDRDRDIKVARENNNYNKDRFLERRQKASPNVFNTGGVGGGVTCGGNMGGSNGGRRNNTIHHINHRQQRLNANLMGNIGGVGAHHHHHLHSHNSHHHHPNHQIINNHHSSSSSSTFIANSSTNPHNLLCSHTNNSTNISFNRPSRINNTPLITATQFNNQMLSKQSNSILVNRRDHRTALNLGLSGTPCTNFSNSNLLLTKANTNPHHLHAAAAGHGIGVGHHHQHHHHHHHHHHGQNSSTNSAGSNTATQITDRILMAASIAAAQRHSLGVVHSAASNAAAVAAASNLNFLQQQNKQKLVIKPFKINDSQPLVAALADSSLVDAIVSKVSTATVAAAESAARRSRSRSRRSRSRNRHENKVSSGVGGNGGGVLEHEGNRRRSTSQSRSSRSSSSSRSRTRSRSRRSSRSHSSQSSTSSRSSSQSSSSSFGSSRSGTRSPSIPRRRGSPSFLDRRRITSARKRPIPYHRKLPSDVSSCYCSSCCSRDSSRSRSPSRGSRSPSRMF